MKRNTMQLAERILPVLVCVAVAQVCGEARAQSRPVEHKKVATQKAAIDPEQMVNIASLHVGDGAADKVRYTFRVAKIPVMVMGSKMYGVLVRYKDRDRAQRLLTADAKKYHYWVRINALPHNMLGKR